MTIYEYFSNEETCENFDELFDFPAMLRGNNVEPHIKDITIQLEKRLLDRIHSKCLSVEQLISMFSSFMGYVLQDIEDGLRSIKVSMETYDILLDIMEIQFPDIPRKAVTAVDYENRYKALDKIISQLIDKSPDVLESDAFDDKDDN